MKKGDKRAALEMSMGTIVILVLSVSMLILGIILVRSIMCSALGLTGEVNDKVKGELNNLFASSETSEVQCVGAAGAVKVAPGETSNIFCSFKAPEKANYTIKVVDFSSDSQSLTKEDIQPWIIQSEYKATISPGDGTPKKAIRVKLPSNAPEVTLILNVQIFSGEEQISTQDLDLQISRTGFVRNTVC